MMALTFFIRELVPKNWSTRPTKNSSLYFINHKSSDCDRNYPSPHNRFESHPQATAYTVIQGKKILTNTSVTIFFYFFFLLKESGLERCLIAFHFFICFLPHDMSFKWNLSPSGYSFSLVFYLNRVTKFSRMSDLLFEKNECSAPHVPIALLKVDTSSKTFLHWE